MLVISTRAGLSGRRGGDGWGVGGGTIWGGGEGRGVLEFIMV